MNAVAKLYHANRRVVKSLRLLMPIAGPGILVADNDAGGIAAHALAVSKSGDSILFLPVVVAVLPACHPRNGYPRSDTIVQRGEP